MAGEWDGLTLDNEVFQGRDKKVRVADLTTLTAAKQRFLDEASGTLGPIIDQEGVTETVFYDKIAALTASDTTGVRSQLLWALGTAYLVTHYRSDYVAAGNADWQKAEDYRRDLVAEVRRLRDLLRRAIDQDEIVFSTSDVTRTALDDAAIYRIG